MKELIKIQSELKAPKNQRNNFGKYNYRSCEDILEAVKPLLKKHECTLVITDTITEVGGIVFVEARAELTKGDETIYVSAQAGIDINRKGMDVAQSFGSSSSYARKYALNGMFLIDDSKQESIQDPDGLETRDTINVNYETKLKSCNTEKELGEYYKSMPTDKQKSFAKLVTSLKLKLNE